MNKRILKKAFRRISLLPVNRYLLYYLANKVKHFYYNLTKSTKVAFPSTVMLELTNHCNLACTICPREYDYGKKMDKGAMRVDQAKKIIDELWPYLDSVGLTGMGETFLYNEIREVAEYIKSKNKGIIISVSTNAVLPGFIEKVAGVIDKIDTIQISVDGLNDIYESIRRNSVFKNFDENLTRVSEICRATDIDLMINMVVTKENFRQMSSLVKYAEQKGIRYMDFTLLNLAAITAIERSYYNFYSSAEFLQAVTDMERTASETVKVYVTKRNFQVENSFQKCHFPWTHFYICWNGYVPPCCAKPFPKELNFGNVFDGSVMAALNSEEFRHFRSLWYKNEAPAFCAKCHFIDIGPIRK